MATLEEGIETTETNQLPLSHSPAPMDQERSMCDRQGLTTVPLQATRGLTRSSYWMGPRDKLPRAGFLTWGPQTLQGPLENSRCL